MRDDALASFVVASYLRRRGDAFADVVRAFEGVARETGAWPTRVDVLGRVREATWEEAARGACAGVPEDALERALRWATRAGDGRFDWGDASTEREGGGRAVEARGTMARMRMRETTGRRADAPAETKTVAKNMNCLRTLRAHRDAAYCAVLSGDGRRLVTGGDDRLVKIWCAHAGLLRAACRGHVGEITYVAIDPRDEVVASASTDTSVRTWSLRTGAPIAVLLGHSRSITELHFCPAAPHVLLSTSDDGTVRLWSALRSSNDVKPMVIDLNVNGGAITGGRVVEHDVMPLAGMASATSPGMRTRGAQLSAIAAESVERGRRNEGEAVEVACGAFNSVGDIFAVGTNSCKVFMWKFDLPALRALGDASPGEKIVRKIAIPGTHLNDVVSVHFSHGGDLLLSASKDGQARVWAPAAGSDRQKWVLRTTLTTPEDAAALREQQRMGSLPSIQYSRRAPKVPNMHIAVWSSDDRRVIASMGDQTIRVFDVSSGELLHSMQEHSAATYVLQPNPLDARLVMSASYDGKAVVWDIVEGVALRIFDGSHYNSKLVDGNWHPDGTTIFVSDLAGQFSIFGTGDSIRLMRAKYEQFLQTEFIGEDSLARSQGGHLIELATGLLLHEAFPRNLLCDAMGDPYPDPYQSAFQSGQVAVHMPTADAGMIDVSIQLPTLAELAPVDVQGPWTMPEVVEEPQRILYRDDYEDDIDNEDEDGNDDDFVEPEEEDDDDDYVSDSEQERRNRRERRQSRRRSRRSRRFDSDESEEESESEELATRRSEREHRRPQRLGIEEYESSSEEDLPTARITRRRRREMTELGIKSDEEEEESESEEKRPAKRVKKEIVSRHDIRLFQAYSWWCAEQVVVGSYVPQLGDEVVYVAQGHYDLMQEMGKDWREEAPWQTLTSMRFVEPCVVSSLRYIIAEDGTYETHCLLELKLIDPACGDYGKEFLIALRRTDSPDFLVPLSRYRTAERVGWKRGDLCAALWDDSGLGDVTPWYGVIEKTRKHEGKWSGSPWNTMCVQYFNVQNEDDKYMNHSFWELYSDDVMRKEHAKLLAGASTSRGPPRAKFSNVDDGAQVLSAAATKELLARTQRLARNSRFEAFVSLIGPNERFARADGTITNYCSLVPVPMALNLIIDRLKNSYYRQVEGFRCDVELIRVNAEIFHGEDSIFAKFAAELEDDLLDDLPVEQREPDIDGMKSYPTIESASIPPGGTLPNGERMSLRVKLRRG